MLEEDMLEVQSITNYGDFLAGRKHRILSCKWAEVGTVEFII